MSNTATAARKEWSLVFRAFRVAHSQVPIMSENGFAVRMEATAAVRAFTGKWDLPTRVATLSHYGMKRKGQLNASRSLRLFLRGA